MSIGKVITIGVISLASMAVGAFIAVKTYPEIKEKIENGDDKKDIVKEVAKSAVPAVGAVGGAVALTALGVVGKHHPLVKDLTANYKHMTYKNSREKIKEKNKEPSNTSDDSILVYDLFTECYFPTTKNEMEKAINELNHDLVFGGKAMLSDLYKHIKQFNNFDTDYDEYGWDWSLADKMHVEPWIRIQYEKKLRFETNDTQMEAIKDGVPDSEVLYVLRYYADRGDGRYYIFDPVKKPKSEKSVCEIYPMED